VVEGLAAASVRLMEWQRISVSTDNNLYILFDVDSTHLLSNPPDMARSPPTTTGSSMDEKIRFILSMRLGGNGFDPSLLRTEM
jgi:hypothetical protein